MVLKGSSSFHIENLTAFPVRSLKPRWVLLTRTSSNLLDLDLVLPRFIFKVVVNRNGCGKCVRNLQAFTLCQSKEEWNNANSFKFRDQFIDCEYFNGLPKPCLTRVNFVKKYDIALFFETWEMTSLGSNYDT